MSNVMKIDNETVSAEQFVKILKFTDEFNDLANRVLHNKVTVHAAKKRGITVSIPEIQQAADDFRRTIRLHRAKDTQEWLDKTGATLEEFEAFVSEQVYRKKMLDIITDDKAIEEYFKLNSPKFDSVDIKHIIVDNEEEAKELIALVNEEPDNFDKFAAEHSLDNETKSNGGRLGGVRRGTMPDEVDAKVFNAKKGSVLGPFKLSDENLYEIIQVIEFHSAKLDNTTKTRVAEAVYNEWLTERMKEHSVTV